MDENTRAQWDLLKDSHITIRATDISSGDFNFGPQIRVVADMLAADGQIGTLTAYLALNPDHHAPVVINFIFSESAPELTNLADTVMHWHYNTGPRELTERATELASKLVRLLAMSAIAGYTEHAEETHRAFVALADV